MTVSPTGQDRAPLTHAYNACCAVLCYSTDILACVSLHYPFNAFNQWWILHKHTHGNLSSHINHPFAGELCLLSCRHLLWVSLTVMTELEKRQSCSYEWQMSCWLETEHTSRDEGQVTGYSQVFAPVETKGSTNHLLWMLLLLSKRSHLSLFKQVQHTFL